MAPVGQMQDFERDALIIAWRADGQTLKAIGLRLGVTRQRVAQLHERAVRPVPAPRFCWCGVEIQWFPGPGKSGQKYCMPEHAPRAAYARPARAGKPQRRRMFTRCSACLRDYLEPKSSPCCSDCGAGFKETRKVHYDVMSAAQGNLCAICNSPESTTGKLGKLRSLAVDHCHETGRVRGLLCMKCNMLLGAAKDDPEILRAAAEYLLEHASAVVDV